MKLVKEVIIAFLLCLVIVSAADEAGNETKVVKGKQTFKRISLCEGCMVGESCIEEGVQKRESIDSPLYYCGSDNKARPAKDVGGECVEDYECKSYFCDGGYCNVIMSGGSTNSILAVVFVGILAVMGGLAFLLFKLGIGFKKVSKEEEKMEKEQKKKPVWQESVKGIKPGAYKYRPEYDALEKRMKEKLKK